MAVYLEICGISGVFYTVRSTNLGVWFICGMVAGLEHLLEEHKLAGVLILWF
jgi:uncharacterized membrane protein